MIAVIFRRITLYHNVKLRGGAMSRRSAETGDGYRRRARFYLRYWRAVGSFFIQKRLAHSLALTTGGSPVGAMKHLLLFYLACVLLTGWSTGVVS